MTDQECMIECAKMCGHQTLIVDGIVCIGHVFKYGVWNPAENIEQAFEVMENFSFYEVTKQSSFSKSWYICEINGFQGTGDTPEQAIFQAAKKYLSEVEG